MRRSRGRVLGPILIAGLVLTGTSGAVAESDAKRFPTLDSLRDASDLIVVGQVTAVEPGEPLVDEANTCESTDATVAISRRLKGEVGGQTVVVHYAGDCGPAPVLGKGIPSGTTLFFLVEEPALGEHSTTTQAIVGRAPDGTIAVRKAGDSPSSARGPAARSRSWSRPRTRRRCPRRTRSHGPRACSDGPAWRWRRSSAS